MNPEIDAYIEKRYERWLDHSRHHCNLNGLNDESVDLLNEVLLSLLSKDKAKIQAMYDKKKGKYRELDFYILKMIQLNAKSPLAPYRWKYKTNHRDENIDISRLKIEEIEYEGDMNSELFSNIEIAFKECYFSDYATKIFEWQFINKREFKDWPGKESTKSIFSKYRKIIKLVKNRIENKSLF